MSIVQNEKQQCSKSSLGPSEPKKKYFFSLKIIPFNILRDIVHTNALVLTKRAQSEEL